MKSAIPQRSWHKTSWGDRLGKHNVHQRKSIFHEIEVLQGSFNAEFSDMKSTIFYHSKNKHQGISKLNEYNICIYKVLLLRIFHVYVLFTRILLYLHRIRVLWETVTQLILSFFPLFSLPDVLLHSPSLMYSFILPPWCTPSFSLPDVLLHSPTLMYCAILSTPFGYTTTNGITARFGPFHLCLSRALLLQPLIPRVLRSS